MAGNVAKTQWRVRWWAWLVGALALTGVATAAIVWGPALYGVLSNADRVRAWVAGSGAWGPAAVLLLEFAQVILAPIPGQAIGAISGFLYGPSWGTLYAMGGVAGGSVFLFAVTRRWGRPVLYRLVGPYTLSRLDDLARRGGALFFFLLWLAPFTPDDMACIAAALTPMSFPRFVILMVVGRLPGVFASVWVGAHAGVLSPTAWVVLLVGVASAAVILWRWGDRIEAVVLRLLARLAGNSTSQ
jgi:uncharacterized membrane protein YdjX (TVP38/TMEM64 family)